MIERTTEAVDRRWHAVASPIITEDMPAWFDHHFDDIFGNNLTETKRQEIRQIAHGYFGRFVDVVKKGFPGDVIALTQEEIDDHYGRRVEEALSQDPNVIIIMNDRYICRGIEERHPHNIFRFSSTRLMGNLDNTKGDQKSKVQPRPGDPSFEEQLQAINVKLAEKGRKLEGSRVIIADDVSTSNGTIDDLAEIFTTIGKADVDISESILNYKIFIRRYDSVRDLRNAMGFVERLFTITAEEREMYASGGTTFTVGKGIAFQQPAHYPWGDGKMIRTDGFLHQNQLDLLQLQTFRDALYEVELSLEGTRRRDGTVFDFFSLKDFRLEIPAGPAAASFPPKTIQIDGKTIELDTGFGSYLGPSALIRDLAIEQRMRGSSRGLHELSMVRYIDIALTLNNEKLKKTPLITHIVEDINGTQRQMKYFDERQRGFRYSLLGARIQKADNALVEKYNTARTRNEPKIKLSPDQSPVDLIYRNSDFTAYLETHFGVQTLRALRKRFIAFYEDEKIGLEEFQIYMKDCRDAGIPLAYHVVREHTWGKVDLDETFEKDTGEARKFNEKIIDQGATIVFLSYSPRIHAMQLLESTGQKHLITSGKAILITMENLYDDKLKKTKKGLVYKAMGRQKPPDDPIQRRVFDRLERKLHDRKARHASLILGTGNMVHSDVRQAIGERAKGFVLNGPGDLDRIFEYARFMSAQTYSDLLTMRPSEGRPDGEVYTYDDKQRYEDSFIADPDIIIEREISD